MYPNLEAEMKRKGMTAKTLATKLNMAESTLSAKMNRKNRMKLDECVQIIDGFFPGMSIEYLFAWAERA